MLKIFFIFFINEICASTESLSPENATFLTKIDTNDSINKNSKNFCRRKESMKNDSSHVEIELEDLGVSTEPSTSDNTKTTYLSMTDEIDSETTTEDDSANLLKEKKSFYNFLWSVGESVI